MIFYEYFSFNLMSIIIQRLFSNVYIVILAVMSVRIGRKIEIINEIGKTQLLLLLCTTNSKIGDLNYLLSHLPCMNKALGSVLTKTK